MKYDVTYISFCENIPATSILSGVLYKVTELKVPWSPDYLGSHCIKSGDFILFMKNRFATLQVFPIGDRDLGNILVSKCPVGERVILTFEQE